MYAPPADRTSPLLAQLARLQAQRGGVPERSGFAKELLAVRNEVAHYAPTAAPRAAATLQRRSRLQDVRPV